MIRIYAELSQATHSRGQADVYAQQLRNELDLPHLHCTTVITPKSGPIYRIATNAHLQTNRSVSPGITLHEPLGR